MEKGPELLSEVLSRLFAARGWGRRQERLRLENVWAGCAGPEVAALSRVAGLKRGVLEIVVANPVLLQELAQFRKRHLLEQLRQELPGATVMDLRFRIGAIEETKSVGRGPSARD